MLYELDLRPDRVQFLLVLLAYMGVLNTFIHLDARKSLFTVPVSSVYRQTFSVVGVSTFSYEKQREMDFVQSKTRSGVRPPDFVTGRCFLRECARSATEKESSFGFILTREIGLECSVDDKSNRLRVSRRLEQMMDQD